MVGRLTDAQSKPFLPKQHIATKCFRLHNTTSPLAYLRTLERKNSIRGLAVEARENLHEKEAQLRASTVEIRSLRGVTENGHWVQHSQATAQP